MKKNVGEIAVNYFQEGLLCSEAVLLSVAEAQGISSPLIPKIATAFGSGLCRTNGMCGALSGGILALSMIKGRTIPTDPRDELYSDVARLKELFETTFHTCDCTALLGFSLAEPEASTKFVEEDCKNKKCSHFISKVANEVMEMFKK